MQSFFNKNANIIVRDFIDEVAENYPAPSKYESLLNLFRKLKRLKNNSLIYHAFFTVAGDSIEFQFRCTTEDTEDLTGEFLSGGDNLIVIYFPKKFLKKVKLFDANNIVDKLKESIVHEFTHFFQEKEKKKFNLLAFGDTFSDPVASRLGAMVYVTHDTELEAIANEAYKMYRTAKRTQPLSYYRCFLAKFAPYILNTYEYTVEICEGTFGFNDIIGELIARRKEGLPDLFSLFYTFYGFLPQTKFGEMIKNDPAYYYYSKMAYNQQLLIDNRDELTDLVEAVIKQKKIPEFEILIKRITKSGEIIKLCSCRESNIEIIDAITNIIFS